jgi:hypothetical protein
VQLLLGARRLDLLRQPCAFFLQQRVQSGLTVFVAECSEQSIDERQPAVVVRLRRDENADLTATANCISIPIHLNFDRR